ncbi:unnamed protein product [Musa hybrid cultivar]
MPIAGHLYRFNLEYLICTALWPASLVIVVAFTAFRESPYGDATAASASATFNHGDDPRDPGDFLPQWRRVATSALP